MNAKQRAALLGLLAGAAHTVLRLFVIDSASSALGASLTQLVLLTFVTTLLTLAVIPGVPLYGALKMHVPSATSKETSLAAVVAAGTAVAVFVSYPFLSAGAAGASFTESLDPRFVGPYLVNALSPAAYSGVGALAGFLLAEQST